MIIKIFLIDRIYYLFMEVKNSTVLVHPKNKHTYFPINRKDIRFK